MSCENKEIYDTIFEIRYQDENKYYVEVICDRNKRDEIGGKDEIGEKDEIRELIGLAKEILIKKIAFATKEEYHLKLLETEEVKNREKYKYKFRVNTDGVIINCLTRQINGFSMWRNYSLHAFSTFDQTIETAVYQAGLYQLQKLAANTTHKNEPISFDITSYQWDLKIYIRCLPFFGSSVLLDKVSFLPRRNLLELDFDLSQELHGKNLCFIDEYLDNSSRTIFKYEFTNDALTNTVLSLISPQQPRQNEEFPPSYR